MAPLIVLGTFGIVAVATHGTVAGGYVLALVAMLFTALSYGKMSRVFPAAGSAYTYVRKTQNGHLGLLVGWAALLDYFFLPMVIWLIGASFLNAEFPAVPNAVWILGFIVTTTILNLLGIVVAERATLLLMAFQVLVIVIFLALSIVHLSQHHAGFVDPAPFWHAGTTLGAVSAGAAIAAYSFLGFDAVTTMAEETRNPQRVIPRAILLVALIGGGIFIVISYAAQLVHPGAQFADPDSASFEIAKQIGGDLFSALFIAGLVVTQFGSGIAAQSSAARLTYAMGRDGVLPRRFFGYIHPRYHTPALNILLSALVGLLALFMNVTTSTSFINFGAFTAFTMVNVSVVAYWVRERRAGRTHNPWGYVVAPAVGALISFFLLTQLDRNALTLGVSWLCIGVVWTAILTKGFRQAPPEMHFEEVDPEATLDRVEDPLEGDLTR
ncbi:amino acid permease [Raineyella fluvialis]|uniref:Amino acid permease n=2 Tax=Raineyella fluvialis TaxID=2662261 RepID=A0A5Q2FHG0_9ACTN|nr:amino acid permease [Raineyella fluvialis]